MFFLMAYSKKRYRMTEPNHSLTTNFVVKAVQTFAFSSSFKRYFILTELHFYKYSHNLSCFGILCLSDL